jgi:hypothetical protein
MIKGFRARLRLFSNEPKTEKSNLFCESESEKNGFLIKVAESGIPPGTFRNQQDILLKTILAGKRKVEEEGKRELNTSGEEKRKLKTSNDFQTKADIEPEVVNHDNVFRNVEFNADVQNVEFNTDVQNDVQNEVKIDIDVVEIERENLSNDAAKVTSIHPDVDRQIQDRQIQDRPIRDQENPNPGQTGSVDDLPESESHQLSDDNDNKNIEVIPKTESELNLNETADQITSIETSRPPSGHHPGQPRRCQSQRENRIVNPRLRKFSVPTTLLEHGIQGNR